MDKGFSVVIGMTLAYAVSFFGLLLAFIVYQQKHHKDDLWRRRPIGVSFFAALYGYVFPLLVIFNALITLLVKLFKGMDYNYLIWSTGSLGVPVLVAVVLFWFLGKLLWRMEYTGYLVAVAVALILMGALGIITVKAIAGGASLHHLGAYVTAVLWHLLWAGYFFSGKVRQAFFSSHAPS
ncbi:MAG: hypothetical protein U9P14_03870 [Gemmatimonadota bacterium]|nr:hypothetical protein [Gemmatimonadota bacterium]